MSANGLLNQPSGLLITVNDRSSRLITQLPDYVRAARIRRSGKLASTSMPEALLSIPECPFGPRAHGKASSIDVPGPAPGSRRRSIPLSADYSESLCNGVVFTDYSQRFTVLRSLTTVNID